MRAETTLAILCFGVVGCYLIGLAAYLWRTR